MLALGVTQLPAAVPSGKAGISLYTNILMLVILTFARLVPDWKAADRMKVRVCGSAFVAI